MFNMRIFVTINLNRVRRFEPYFVLYCVYIVTFVKKVDFFFIPVTRSLIYVKSKRNPKYSLQKRDTETDQRYKSDFFRSGKITIIVYFVVSF